MGPAAMELNVSIPASHFAIMAGLDPAIMAWPCRVRSLPVFGEGRVGLFAHP